MQSNRAQGHTAHFRKNRYRLLLGNWNVLILKGKELELVEEPNKYHLIIVEVSSTKRRVFRIVDLDGGWRLCIRLDSFGITDLYVKAQSKGPIIMPIAGTASGRMLRANIRSLKAWALGCIKFKRFFFNDLAQ